MSRVLYSAGRICQVIGLVSLPGAIWAGEIHHSESASILIFTGSIVIFFAGYILIHFSKRV